MKTPSLFGAPRIWSVSELTRHIRQLLESDYRLQEIWVSGEASNVSLPASGHLYFSLQDATATLRCVMWRSQVALQTHLPKDGETFEVFGRIGVYEAGGQYQLYAEVLRPAGEGLRYQEFMERKARLETEGLFDAERKRPLPEWPRTIGVVTSPTGAALRDVLHVLQRRFPLVQVLLAPTAVQGPEAAGGVASALEALNQHGGSDVILVVRGGGSVEDLWTFNEEAVVRAVAASSIPVVTGIGHETDLILADFAADVRAPTPSAAAEVVTPDREALLHSLARLRADLLGLFQDQIGARQEALAVLQARLRQASPRAHIENARQRVDEFWRRAHAAIRHDLIVSRRTLDGLAHTLQAVGPAAVLSRGYAIVTQARDGAIVRSVSQVDPGDPLHVRVQDGSFGARVEDHEGSEDT